MEPTNLNDVANGRDLGTPLLLGPLLVVYAVFLSTGDIQEDAFITFRTAFHLADHGELSFNLGEAHSGATSYLYPLLVALVRMLCGEYAVTAILIVNSIALLATTRLLARVLGCAFDFSPATQRLLWAVLSVGPVTLLMAVRGMEAPYVALLFALGLRRIQQAPEYSSSLLPPLLLPFVRPDAIAFGLILSGYALCARAGEPAPSGRLRLGARYAAAATAGAALLVLANQLSFGSPLPPTVSAKSLWISESRSLLALAFGDGGVFTSSLFSPVTLKYLDGIYPLFALLALALSASLLWRSWHARRSQLSVLAALLAGIWLVPTAYVFVGVVAPWYLWPSRLLYQALLLAGVVDLSAGLLRPAAARRVVGALSIALLGASGLQLVLSYSRGVQENSYRASVGRFIASRAEPGDTLFLEPAGYIPFYAGLRTIDEVGLASPVILGYKRAFPERWWIEAVGRERPTFLVQRGHIVDHRTYQGYQMTPAEADWFDRRYELVRHSEYRPQTYTAVSFLKRILALGSHSDYYVFELRERGGGPGPNDGPGTSRS